MTFLLGMTQILHTPKIIFEVSRTLIIRILGPTVIPCSVWGFCTRKLHEKSCYYLYTKCMKFSLENPSKKPLHFSPNRVLPFPSITVDQARILRSRNGSRTGKHVWGKENLLINFDLLIDSLNNLLAYTVWSIDS
jgi:hypothetical protein